MAWLLLDGFELQVIINSPFASTVNGYSVLLYMNNVYIDGNGLTSEIKFGRHIALRTLIAGPGVYYAVFLYTAPNGVICKITTNKITIVVITR
ncbi:MAG: hypothetical protein IPO92_14795 [Saprospiraceae bacterium]|nr:hypothetical protein [Saprospiraceae bacterium]